MNSMPMAQSIVFNSVQETDYRMQPWHLSRIHCIFFHFAILYNFGRGGIVRLSSPQLSRYSGTRYMETGFGRKWVGGARRRRFLDDNKVQTLNQCQFILHKSFESSRAHNAPNSAVIVQFSVNFKIVKEVLCPVSFFLSSRKKPPFGYCSSLEVPLKIAISDNIPFFNAISHKGKKRQSPPEGHCSCLMGHQSNLCTQHSLKKLCMK